MLKKLFLSFVAVVFVFTSISVFTNSTSNTASAATKCVNPYKGYLAKYNPCITHTETSYIDVKKDKYGTPIALTAVGVTTALADKKALTTLLGKVVGKFVPVAGQVVLLSDAVTVVNHYTAKSLLKNGIVRFKVTTKWKYKLNPLSDGGGIPKKSVVSVSTKPIKK